MTQDEQVTNAYEQAKILVVLLRMLLTINQFAILSCNFKIFISATERELMAFNYPD